MIYGLVVFRVQAWSEKNLIISIISSLYATEFAKTSVNTIRSSLCIICFFLFCLLFGKISIRNRNETEPSLLRAVNLEANTIKHSIAAAS